MAIKKITMHRKTTTGYDDIYPKTEVSQVDGLQTELDSKQDDLTEIQSFANNKYLHSNSSTGALEWADADALPPQAGQAGKFLTTDGTTASWANNVVTNTASVSLVLTSGIYSYVVTHGLNTKDVIVQVYDTVTDETIFVDVTRTTVNTATIEFSELPSSSGSLHNCEVLFTAMSASSVPSAEGVYF